MEVANSISKPILQTFGFISQLILQTFNGKLRGLQVMPAAVTMQSDHVTYSFDLLSTTGGQRTKLHQFGGR